MFEFFYCFASSFGSSSFDVLISVIEVSIASIMGSYNWTIFNFEFLAFVFDFNGESVKWLVSARAT